MTSDTTPRPVRAALLAHPALTDDPEKVPHTGMHHLAFEYAWRESRDAAELHRRSFAGEFDPGTHWIYGCRLRRPRWPGGFRSDDVTTRTGIAPLFPESQSLVDRVGHAVRRAILEGRLRPGETLSISDHRAHGTRSDRTARASPSGHSL